jgi:ribonuclease E
MKKEMLINVLQPEECRIAIVEDGVLEELYVERTSHESYVGNIYKGRIVNIEPSIQAAFVDFGVGRNGFLHVSDVEPAYYRHLEQRRDAPSRRGPARGRAGRGRPQDSPRPTDDDSAFERSDARDSLEEGEYTAANLFVEETGSVEAAAPEAETRPWPADEPATDDPAAGVGTQAQASDTHEAASPASPETPPEREPRGGRRRGRGRSRRARGVAQPSPTDAAAGAEPESAEAGAPPAALPEQPTAERSEHEPPPHGERPRLMDSAERRTEESDLSPRPAEPTHDFADEDLSFSRPAAPAAAPEVLKPEPSIVERREQPLEEGLAPLGVGGVEALEMDDVAEERLEDFDGEEADGRRPRRPLDERRGRRNGGRRLGGRPGSARPKPLIQDIFKRGQEVLVQVIKEGIGTKGPTLSTYISIAGRYLVLMPGLNRIGVSRKIADDEQRRRLRDILNELQPPKGLGFIIRTAGLDRTKKELQRDLAYLSRLWQVVVRRIKKLKTPAEIYQESDMITRTIRDTFTGEIDSILVDEPAAFEHAQEFMQIVMPRYALRLKLYAGTEPMFHKYGIEDEIARIQRRHVPLPNGGSIVIDQTEALVAIDVNSGNFRADNNAEETAYQMNLLAAKEIARQLRLRDLGGVIVNDFIDMRDEKHRRGVERAVREAVRRDRARTKILRISQFGLIEMTRQRIRPSLKRSVYQDCPHCSGTGQVKTCESMSIDVMRMLQLAAHRAHVHRIAIRVHEDVANYLLNRKRKDVNQLEETGEIQVMITGAAGVSPELLEFECYDKNNNEVKFLSYEENRPRRR